MLGWNFVIIHAEQPKTKNNNKRKYGNEGNSENTSRGYKLVSKETVVENA